MADVKWIKVVTNIFDDEKIKYIETLPKGNEYIVLWFKLLCQAGKSNQNGALMLTDKISYNQNFLSSILSVKFETLAEAINLFTELEMIENLDGKLVLLNWEKHQNAEKLERMKIQNRERVARYKNKNTNEPLIEHYESINEPLAEHYINATDIDKDIDKDINNIINEENIQKSKKFVKPTIEEIGEYIFQNNFKVDKNVFYDYYESNGWKIGKAPMKDWKATVRRWNSTSGQYSNKKTRVEIPMDYSSQNQVTLTNEEIENIKNSIKSLGS